MLMLVTQGACEEGWFVYVFGEFHELLMTRRSIFGDALGSYYGLSMTRFVILQYVKKRVFHVGGLMRLSSKLHTRPG